MSENASNSRRYAVKGYATSPAWSGCVWTYGCKTLEGSRKSFGKAVEKERLGAGTADAILLIDRESHQIIDAFGAENPELVANSFGW